MPTLKKEKKPPRWPLHEFRGLASFRPSSGETHVQQHGKVHVDETMPVTEVHVTETANEASLHAIAEAVAEFAIGD